MQKEVRILMLENSEEEAGKMLDALKDSKLVYTSARTSCGNEACNYIDSFRPDIILASPSPAIDVIDALRQCLKKTPDIPFIVVSDSVSEEFAVEALRSGAFDYIIKPDLSRLPLTIKSAIQQRRQENSRRRHEVLLRHQNAELKKVNRDLEMFVHSTSHNLRAPLRSVLGLIYLSRQELAAGKLDNLDQYYGLMENSIHALDDTIKLILDYSRTKQLVEEVEEIDFERMFEEIFNNLEHINSPEAITKEVTVHPGRPFYCSRMKLYLILLNIVSNAIKYYDPAKERSYVRMQVRRVSEQAVIEIEDNGIGIPLELQQRVFDMFYRATESSEGSGLGLFIVKETIEKLGGTIELSSVPGLGTTFRLVIPNYVSSASV
ncbi:sensor histidine kinase [Chryseolinea sp. T2]|uniref:sensor histidine kinase n=1 Tax=Chryseolinea sp. T2 TaxID=3129255 RepID=UPI0030779C94